MSSPYPRDWSLLASILAMRKEQLARLEEQRERLQQRSRRLRQWQPPERSATPLGSSASPGKRAVEKRGGDCHGG